MTTTNCIGTGEMRDDDYRPIMDWTMVTGARVSEKRLQQLENFDFDGFSDLTLDDIFACNNRKFQRLLWSLADVGENLFGETKTNEFYYKLGYGIGQKGWTTIMKRFNTEKLTPAQVAWYQDMAHFFYGPHCQAYTEYTDDTVVVTRQDCLVSMPPPGMEDKNKYLKPFGDGYLDGYRDLAPYITIDVYSFITPDEMGYKVDLSKYPSFCTGKRAGDPFHQLIFKWIA